MTDRANLYIDRLLKRRDEGVRMDCESKAVELRQEGLDPVEAGWVLHHVFGRPMGEAVHLATICDWNIIELTTAVTYVRPLPPRVTTVVNRGLSELRRERRELARAG